MTRYRVACRDFTGMSYPTLEAAERKLAKVEKLGECFLLHTIQVEQEDGEWLPLHEHRARLILAAPLRAEFDGLIKYHGNWSKEAGERADAAGVSGSQAWFAALGPNETATLTGDGRGTDVTGWCKHKPPADTWVRYERWSARGIEAHGYVCPDVLCRKLTQTG